MPKQSAGILLYKKANNELLIYLIHPGGPFFKNKDEGVWSLPKGEFEDDEEPLTAAKREFEEETGQTIDGDFFALGTIKQKSGKIVHAWAVEGNAKDGEVISNLFEMEWPPRSGKKQSFHEVDRAAWFTVKIAKQKINPAQIPLIDNLIHLL
jgi:predicted NUDIX family NTP pyrophosphohydrolase